MTTTPLPDPRANHLTQGGTKRLNKAAWIYRAGRDWPDARWTPAIADALVKTGKAAWIYDAGLDWSDARRAELKRDRTDRKFRPDETSIYGREKMTVRELRHLLFNVENQDAQVLVVTPSDIKFGEIVSTHQLITGRQLGSTQDEDGYVTIHTM